MSEIEALLPEGIARKAERLGVDKVRLDAARLLALSVLAGAFIAFGAMVSTIAASASGGGIPDGIVRLTSGVVFSLGLILVVVGGAELFTGNLLMVMAWAGRKITLPELVGAWSIVYIGNFVGASATALLVFLSGLHDQDAGQVGAAALTTLQAKAALPFFPALVKGVLANVLVCLAVWLSYSARTTTDKILAVVPPVAALVAAGFEHSIANMYLMPYGLLVRDWADGAFWTAIGKTPLNYATSGWDSLLSNLVPVTIGNCIGGGVLVGAVYWFVYLRKTDTCGADRDSI